MYLVLASPGDDVASGLSALLEERTRNAEVVHAGPHNLVVGATWTHRLDAADSSTTISLAEGRRLRSQSIRAVVNRLRHVEAPSFSDRRDHDYAQLETFALTLSWLRSLPCPMINPPDPRGLSGPELPLSVWLALASTCGLPVVRTKLTTNAREHGSRELIALPDSSLTQVSGPQEFRTPAGRMPATYVEPARPVGDVVVVGDQVVGPPEFWDASRRLARRVGCNLLRIGFGRTRAGHLAVSDVSPHPDWLSPAAAEAAVGFLIATGPPR